MRPNEKRDWEILKTNNTGLVNTKTNTKSQEQYGREDRYRALKGRNSIHKVSSKWDF